MLFNNFFLDKFTFNKSEENAGIMKKFPMDIIESSKCEDEWRTSRLGPKFNLHDTFVCAGDINGTGSSKVNWKRFMLKIVSDNYKT